MAEKKQEIASIVMYPKKSLTSMLEQVRLNESYVSLLMGIVVVVFSLFILVTFVKSKKIILIHSPKKEISSQKTENLEKIKMLRSQSTRSYVVLENDDLSNISKKFYNTEDYWIDIAKENNLEDPYVLTVGMMLKIPALTEKINGMTQDAITKDAYTVRDGDNLWSIAVRAYGDGFRWVDIVKANNLSSPDNITTGQVLKLPR